MKITIETTINNQHATIDIKTAVLTEKDGLKTGPVKGYACEYASVNGTEISTPEHVVLYADTFKKQGPEICFKFSAGREMQQQFALKPERMVFIPVPKKDQKAFLQMMEGLDYELAIILKKADDKREANDRKIQASDKIEMTLSPRFVGVRYPNPSNREKEESRMWCRCFENEKLEDWVEVALEPYCQGLGCGSQKKYELTYAVYDQLYQRFIEKCKEVL